MFLPLLNSCALVSLQGSQDPGSNISAPQHTVYLSYNIIAGVPVSTACSTPADGTSITQPIRAERWANARRCNHCVRRVVQPGCSCFAPPLSPPPRDPGHCTRPPLTHVTFIRFYCTRLMRSLTYTHAEPGLGIIMPPDQSALRRRQCAAPPGRGSQRRRRHHTSCLRRTGTN